MAVQLPVFTCSALKWVAIIVSQLVVASYSKSSCFQTRTTQGVILVCKQLSQELLCQLVSYTKLASQLQFVSMGNIIMQWINSQTMQPANYSYSQLANYIAIAITAMHCAYPDLMLQLEIFQLMMQHCQVASMLDLLYITRKS